MLHRAQANGHQLLLELGGSSSGEIRTFTFLVGEVMQINAKCDEAFCLAQLKSKHCCCRPLFDKVDTE